MQTPTSSCRHQSVVGSITPIHNGTSKCVHQASSKHQPSTPIPNNCLSVTPKNKIHYTPSPIYNPFESDYESLQHGILTPGIFKKTVEATPDAGKKFQWDIEHVALLNPVDFGDLTEKLKRQDRQCREMDHLAQTAVDKFFESKHIVPSPWSEPVQRVNLLARIEEEEKSIVTSDTRRNVSSQTDVHIPASVDLDEFFKKYRLSDSQMEEINRAESLSNSSLRRKLFGNDSDSSNSSHNTPERISSPSVDCWNSPPLDELRSSSPMLEKSSVFQLSRRRCSMVQLRDGASRDASPNLSPISSPIKCLHDSDDGVIVKSSPDMREHKNMSSVGFNLQDEFQISNDGLTCGSDWEDSKPAESMSIDLQSFNFDTHDPNGLEYLNIDGHPVKDDDALYHCATFQSASDQITDLVSCSPGRSDSDTGYQTVNMSCTADMSLNYDQKSLSKASVIQSSATSPLKSETNWEPHVASTPNKSSLMPSNE